MPFIGTPQALYAIVVVGSAVITGVGYARFADQVARVRRETEGGRTEGTFDSVSVREAIRMGPGARVSGDLRIEGSASISAGSIFAERLEVDGDVRVGNVTISRGGIRYALAHGEVRTRVRGATVEISGSGSARVSFPGGISTSGGAAFSAPSCIPSASTCGVRVDGLGEYISSLGSCSDPSRPSCRSGMPMDGDWVSYSLLSEGPVVLGEGADLVLGDADIYFREGGTGGGNWTSFRRVVEGLSNETARFAADYDAWRESVGDLEEVLDDAERLAAHAILGVEAHAAQEIRKVRAETDKLRGERRALEERYLEANSTLQEAIDEVMSRIRLASASASADGEPGGAEEAVRMIILDAERARSAVARVERYISLDTGVIHSPYIDTDADIFVGGRSVDAALRAVEALFGPGGGAAKVYAAAADMAAWNATAHGAAAEARAALARIAALELELERAVGSLPAVVEELRNVTAHLEDDLAALRRVEARISENDDGTAAIMGVDEYLARQLPSFDDAMRRFLSGEGPPPESSVIRAQSLEASDVVVGGVSLRDDVLPAMDGMRECGRVASEAISAVEQSIERERELRLQVEDMERRLSALSPRQCDSPPLDDEVSGSNYRIFGASRRLMELRGGQQGASGVSNASSTVEDEIREVRHQIGEAVAALRSGGGASASADASARAVESLLASVTARLDALEKRHAELSSYASFEGGRAVIRSDAVTVGASIHAREIRADSIRTSRLEAAELGGGRIDIDAPEVHIRAGKLRLGEVDLSDMGDTSFSLVLNGSEALGGGVAEAYLHEAIGMRRLMSSDDSSWTGQYCGSYFGDSKRAKDDVFDACERRQREEKSGETCVFQLDVNKIDAWQMPKYADINFCLPSPERWRNMLASSELTSSGIRFSPRSLDLPRLLSGEGGDSSGPPIIDGICVAHDRKYRLQIVHDSCMWWDCTGLVAESYVEAQARLQRLFLTGLLPAIVCPSGTFGEALYCPPGYVMGGPFVDISYTATTGYRGAMCCRIQAVGLASS